MAFNEAPSCFVEAGACHLQLEHAKCRYESLVVLELNSCSVATVLFQLH